MWTKGSQQLKEECRSARVLEQKSDRWSLKSRLYLRIYFEVENLEERLLLVMMKSRVWPFAGKGEKSRK